VSTYNVVKIDEIEAVPYLGGNLIPVRYTLGLRAVGVNAWAADEGGQLVPPHAEDSGSEELYVVLRGRAQFMVGGETGDAPAGTVVFVPPEVERTAVAEEPGTIVLAAGGRVGEPFRGAASAWDTFAIADAHRRAGRIEEGRAVLRKARDDAPDSWALTYNSGCWEALAGNPDEAFVHLKRALEMNESEVPRYLAEDSDLDSLRDDPRFRELVE
jgi:mannose-6-phosphate isomerase-like protein (cupin superfamily)